uniref:LPXTG cell wall anchor domain-containing protein n=1 Tax=Streptococcus didelphis TaxID=102886 RepID=UPI0027D2E15B|nr:LPXTG cell wall anchor domain-containing protein [Streptococcus didelphis]
MSDYDKLFAKPQEQTQTSAAQAKANQLPATGDSKNPFFTAAAMFVIAGAGSLGLLPNFKRK